MPDVAIGLRHPRALGVSLPVMTGDSGDMFGAGPAENEDLTPSAAELEAAGQAAMFGEAPAPKPAAAVAKQPYRVLARKYRPQTFAALIGQDAMVQTLGNAIKRDRLAHAFLMTGVRGVGKTSTARLIAKALNCIGADGSGGPTIDPCGVCEPCVAIAEGRHIDVIEMDAASHTGVDDVREIIEAVRYAAVSARYKIYIIDEVHMLSRNAFNALLKTLEEPPAHVKFLFATTEVDKLPVTVLSRCQRFDLRRIPAGLLAEHFGRVCAAEGVAAEDEALGMIAEAAEGSVRDGLSILDQAIAHADLNGGAVVTAAQVREMLGLADRSVRRRLFGAILAGDAAGLLDLVAAQYALGVEPLAMVRAAMDLCHRVTVCQIGKGPAAAIAPEERAAIEDWAQALGAGALHRMWQLLLRAHDEVKSAPEPLVAAEMALLRCLHASDLPDPGELVRRVEAAVAAGGVFGNGAAAGTVAPGAETSLAPVGLDWAALVTAVEACGKDGALTFGSVMRMQVRVIDLQPGVLVYAQPPEFRDDNTGRLRAMLNAATGGDWVVERRPEGGAPALVEAEEASRADAKSRVLQSPLVMAALAAFPGAKLIEDADGESPSGWQRRQRG